MLVDQYSNQDTTVLVNKYDADSLSALRPCPLVITSFILRDRQQELTITKGCP